MTVQPIFLKGPVAHSASPSESGGVGSSPRGEGSSLSWGLLRNVIRQDPTKVAARALSVTRQATSVLPCSPSKHAPVLEPSIPASVLKHPIGPKLEKKWVPPPSLLDNSGLTRYILTNTGSLTTPQLYSALTNALKHHPPTMRGLVKVKQIYQPNWRQHFDLWVKNEVAAGLQKSLQLDYHGRLRLTETLSNSKDTWIKTITSSMLPRYRLSLWKAYRDRVIQHTKNPSPETPLQLGHFMTWNINGVSSKFPVLKEILHKNNVSIAGVQEHLRNVYQYTPAVKEYNLFDQPKEEGFRGHCLYVHTSLAANEVQTNDRHIIYVKVFGLSNAKTWHILSVYLPSGNLRRKDRALQWKKLSSLLLPLTRESGKPLITIMGDFNQNEDTVHKIINCGSLKCLNLQLCNDPSSSSTREVKNKEGRSLDHYINSPAAYLIAKHAKVDNLTTDVSDHWPVFLKHEPVTNHTSSKEVWNRKFIKGHGIELALSKKCDCLRTDHINNEEDLNEVASEWVETLNTAGRELGLLRIPKEQRQLNFDKATKAKIVRSRKTRKALQQAQKASNHKKVQQLQAILITRSAEAKKAIKKYAQHIKLVKSRETDMLLMANEGADFHKLLHQAQGKSITKQDNAPCFNNEEKLMTDPESILRARAAYSEKLAADPSRISRDPAKWSHIKASNIKFDKLHISRTDNQPTSDSDSVSSESSTIQDSESGLDADAFIMAIRQIKQNAAPGKSGVLAVHLKKFLEIECQLQITKEWENCPTNQFGDKKYPKPLDYSATALDRWSPPSTLITPPLVHLLNIMQGCIRLKTQPALWNKKILITLPKPGQDLRYLKNTQGITLSCTEGKLLLTIIARDISDKLERQGFFTKAQAGFWNGQEAMAHVISLNEIIRRRRNAKINTYVLYIDFKKAFDRVPHERMWAKLLNIGIHPDLVAIIKKGYNNSAIQCRVDDKLSDPFTRQIGTRQGCPLSPLLFIIFVNDIKEVTKGITVPGLREPAKGLLFADDTLMFADNSQEITQICKNLENYCAKWHFALGHDKYGPQHTRCQ
ncbi:hypothetical protein PtB15_11B309 [Puccinia triticina]|nr:hypothetical protein PtB15_11B309 [Puccinia triticina]